MRVFILLLLFFSTTRLYADLGGCLVYKVKYVLKNGTNITGYLPLSGYGDYTYLDEATQTNKYCSDKAFQKLINDVFYHQQRTLVFDIYTELHLIQFVKPAEVPWIVTAFTDSSSVRQLHLDSIKYTVFLSAKPAQWSFPEVSIQIYDPQTSLFLQKTKAVNFTGLSYPPVLEAPESTYYHTFDNYLVINFNEKMSLPDLEKEMEKVRESIYAPELKYVKSSQKNKEKIFEQEKRDKVLPILKALQSKGIFLVFVQQTC